VKPSAAVVAVGDELLAGSHPDLDSPEIARALAGLGIPVKLVTVVGDDEQPIADVVARLAERFELVLVTGGLGPTLDDVTRHAVARALDRELVVADDALAQVAAWWAGRGVPMPDANRRQALVPAGAAVLPNSEGTAPGFRAETERGHVLALPGPPRELRAMLAEQVVPWLRGAGLGAPVADPLAPRRLHLFGLSESLFAERAGEWMARDASPLVGCTVKDGVLTVTLRARGDDRERALAALDARVEEFRARFADHLFSEHEPRLERVLVDELRDRGLTLATAESCTGGLVASLVTTVPGASDVFEEARVTYARAAKERLLGVPAELLERHGEVSSEVAGAMAAGLAERSGASLALSITGVAGPAGGSEEKPVGLVWFGVAHDGRVETSERRFPRAGREWIQLLSARTALFLGLRRVRGRG
jgi:nicotinamide-nucleotide amidase